jgi:hypothetical protein
LTATPHASLRCQQALALLRSVSPPRRLSSSDSSHPYGVYLVTDDMFDTGNLGDKVKEAIDGGTTIVQLRCGAGPPPPPPAATAAACA